ncbi:MAG: DHH family protein [Candidatus Methanofastidiosum methylothiophilum]|uniref:DHH family protein n=1 Tax=Candidatus Methanofastidiosum methylothiophilum TaxID=1705564 RepID=A0A150IPZ8_9EURY|nr:MAG: DHH family protein [Candidatus Methanofastidiosum methylthiophilus]KYC47121.1 MAG: DHH family protein [Candidatus Methanofastidiosum methylthiophilus]KYC51221.1 MAG: DHH family protein [Candidatus Methanofastidiosum methylthiophilus]
MNFNVMPVKISEISFDMEGQYVSVEGKITDIYQTSGPLVFRIYDGSEIRAVIFNPVEGFHSLKIGDFVRFYGVLSIRRENVELQISNFERLDETELNLIKQNIENMFLDKIKRDAPDFLVSSEIYKKMEGQFLLAMTAIKKAVLQERMIIIRHHNDCDGITAGVSLEKAITSYAEREKKKDCKVFRKPCAAPYYDLEDSLKDIDLYFSFSKKKPLLIIADNGSTDSDLQGILRAKVYDFEIGVIDHHPPTKNENGEYIIDKYVSFHINPHIYSGDSNLCTGMLAYEVSRMIDSGIDSYGIHIPALAGVGDKSKGIEMDQYLETSPFKREELERIKLALDHESYYVGRFGIKNYIEDIMMIGDRDRGNLIIDYVSEEIDKKRISQWNLIKKYLEIKNLSDNFDLISVELDKLIFRGEFPSPGRTLGFIHNKYIWENEINEDERAIISMGMAEDYLVIRATNKAKSIGFDLNDIIKQLKDLYLEEVQGGGHPGAGTIRFVPILKDEVRRVSLEYIEKVVKKNDI